MLLSKSLLTASWLGSTHYPVFRLTFLEWHVISREMCEAVDPLRLWFCLTFNCRMCYNESRRYYFNRLVFSPPRFTPAVFIEPISLKKHHFPIQSTGIRGNIWLRISPHCQTNIYKNSLALLICLLSLLKSWSLSAALKTGHFPLCAQGVAITTHYKQCI